MVKQKNLESIRRRKLYDGIAMALGAWLGVSGAILIGSANSIAVLALFFLGAAMMLFALWGESLYKNAAPEVFNLLVAIAAFMSPWVFSFTGNLLAAWSTWLVAVAVLASELMAMPWETLSTIGKHKTI